MVPEKNKSLADKEYKFKYLIDHLTNSGRENWVRMLSLLETSQFLAEKARFLQTYLALSEDLERFVLPCTVQLKAWPRFFHFAVMALNLRGMAETLTDSVILKAMGRSHRTEQGLAVVEQLSDPLARARARANLLAQVKLNKTLTEFSQRIIKELDGLVAPTQEKDAIALTDGLTSIAEDLGDLLNPHWQRWFGYLAQWPRLMDRLYLALARHRCKRVGLDDIFWLHLGNLSLPITDEVVLLAFPKRFSDPQPERTAKNLWDLCRQDRDLFWKVLIALWVDLKERSPEDPEVFVRLIARYDVPWTLDLLEQGKPLWPTLPFECKKTILENIDDPVAQAGFKLLIGLYDDRDQVIGALDLIPGAVMKMFLVMTVLESEVSDALKRDLFQAVENWLVHVRYDLWASKTAAILLARFLDLATSYEYWTRHLENLVKTPGLDSERLVQLVSAIKKPEALRYFFLNSPRFAAIVSSDREELRTLLLRLLIPLSGRLCAAENNLDALDHAEDLLLPHEQDNFHLGVAWSLAEAGKSALALSVSRRLTSGRTRTLHLLRLFPDDLPNDFWDEKNLYEALVEITDLEDELTVLSTLSNMPTADRGFLEERVWEIHGEKRRASAMLDFVASALSWDAHLFPSEMRNPKAAVRFFGVPVAAPVSEDQELHMLPLWVSMGFALDPFRFVDDLSQAVFRIFSLESVPFETRLETFEILLGRIRYQLRELKDDRSDQAKMVRNHISAFLGGLLSLPDQPELEARQQEIKDNWHRLIPPFSATLSFMPAKLKRPIERKYQHFSETKWSWLSPTQKRVLALCIGDSESLVECAGRQLAFDATDPEICMALAYLLSGHRTDLVCRLLAQQTFGARTKRIFFGMVRDGWLPEKCLPKVLDLIPPGFPKSLGFVYAGYWSDWVQPRTWVEELVKVATADWASVLCPHRVVWKLRGLAHRGGPPIYSILAEWFPDVVARADRNAAVNPLIFWMNAFLAPIPGDHPGERPNLIEALDRAMNRARVLSPEAISIPSPTEPSKSEYAETVGTSNSPQGIEKGFDKFNWRTLHREWTAWQVGILVGMVAGTLPGFYAPIVQGVLFGGPVELPGYFFRPWAMILLTLACFVQSLLLNSFLFVETKEIWRIRRTFRAACFLLGMVPLYGMFVLPLWRWGSRTEKPWAVKSQAEIPALTLRVRSPDQLGFLQQLYSSLGHFLGKNWVLMAIIFFPLVPRLWPFVDSKSYSMTHPLMVPLGLVALIFYLVPTFSMGWALYVLGHKGRKSTFLLMVMVSLSLAWLIPIAGIPLLLGFFPLVLIFMSGPVDAKDDSIIFRIFKEKSPEPSHIDPDRQVPVDSKPNEGRHTQGFSDLDKETAYLYWFCRSKTFFLFCESACLTWISLYFSWPFQSIFLVFGWIVISLLILSFALGTVGIGWMYLKYRKAKRRGGPVSGLPSPARYLALTQFALAAGMILGLGLFRGDALLLLAIMTLFGMLAGVIMVIIQVFGEPVSPQVKPPGDDVIWGIGWILLAMAGFGSVSDPYLGNYYLEMAALMVLLGTMGGSLVEDQFRPWLFRPFSVHAQEKGSLPHEAGSIFRWLAWAAILPLGGLILPLWLRARRRQWPNLVSKWYRAQNDPFWGTH